MLIVRMKIQLEKNNKIFVFQGSEKKELHPIWLRERVSEKEYLDANTEQRLFDPSFLKNITIKDVKNVNWKEINEKLPYKKNKEQKKIRI